MSNNKKPKPLTSNRSGLNLCSDVSESREAKSGLSAPERVRREVRREENECGEGDLIGEARLEMDGEAGR